MMWLPTMRRWAARSTYTRSLTRAGGRRAETSASPVPVARGLAPPRGDFPIARSSMSLVSERRGICTALVSHGSPSGARGRLPGRVMPDRPSPRLRRRQGDPMRFARLAALAALAVAVLAAPLAGCHAQPASSQPRIGYLATSPSDSDLEPFRQALRGLGWIDGQNITIEVRWTEGRIERTRDFVAELVRLKVDVIYAEGSVATARAAKEATTTIP